MESIAREINMRGDLDSLDVEVNALNVVFLFALFDDVSQNTLGSVNCWLLFHFFIIQHVESTEVRLVEGRGIGLIRSHLNDVLLADKRRRHNALLE